MLPNLLSRFGLGMKQGGAVLSMRLVRRICRAYIMDGTCFTVNKTQTSRLKWRFCLWENARAENENDNYRLLEIVFEKLPIPP